MRKITALITLCFLITIVATFGSVISAVSAQEKVFTEQELATFNGKDGNKSYTAYKGVVYDVSNSVLWELGEHFGLEAGKDLTEAMDEAPHGEEVFAGFQVVGRLEVSAASGTQAADTALESDDKEVVSATTAPATKQWWEGRIKFFNITVLGWTGILMGVFFILTFATCFAMPWAKLPVPWHGSKPGPDPLDATSVHMPWSSVHKHFVWWTVSFGVIHGVLGFMQMLGFYL